MNDREKNRLLNELWEIGLERDSFKAESIIYKFIVDALFCDVGKNLYLEALAYCRDRVDEATFSNVAHCICKSNSIRMHELDEYLAKVSSDIDF